MVILTPFHLMLATELQGTCVYHLFVRKRTAQPNSDLPLGFLAGPHEYQPKMHDFNRVKCIARCGVVSFFGTSFVRWF